MLLRKERKLLRLEFSYSLNSHFLWVVCYSHPSKALLPTAPKKKFDFIQKISYALSNHPALPSVVPFKKKGVKNLAATRKAEVVLPTSASVLQTVHSTFLQLPDLPNNNSPVVEHAKCISRRTVEDRCWASQSSQANTYRIKSRAGITVKTNFQLFESATDVIPCFKGIARQHCEALPVAIFPPNFKAELALSS